MNDFDYDVAQKKRIARGAFNRKGTVNRKGCTLPHELLTKKELNKLNGEIKTLCMNDKLTWEEFKELDTELQTEYLQHKLNCFGIGLSTIGVGLFGLTQSTLAKHCKSKGIKVEVRNKGKAPVAAMVSWQRWLDGEAKTAPETKTAPIPPAAEAPVKPFRAHDFKDLFRDCGMEQDTMTVEREKRLYPMNDMSMTLIGTPVDILDTLRTSFPALLDEDRQYRFQIKVDGFTKGWRTDDV